MTTRDVNKARIGLHRVEHAETISSPHTYANAVGGGATHGAVPATTLPERPVVSNIRTRSAVAGVPPEVLRAMCGAADAAAHGHATTAASDVTVKSERHHGGDSSSSRGGRSKQAPHNDDDSDNDDEQAQVQRSRRRATHGDSSSGSTRRKPERDGGVKLERRGDNEEDDGDAVSGNNSNQDNGSSNVDTSSTTRRVVRMSFDVSGISPPIANMMRRLMTTEVPTLAFDRVLIEENDSVVLDELLCHRIGLVPLAGPVARMEYVTAADSVAAGQGAAAAAAGSGSSGSSSVMLDPRRVLVFDLCAEGRADAAVTPVYSGALRWVPLPGQEVWQHSDSDDDRVFLVHDDILLTKLGPQQKLKLRAFAIKGIAAVHAKWSPVSACYYAMQTSITLTAPITGADAEALVKTSPAGVFGIDADGHAVVLDASKYTMDRECLRGELYPSFASKICIEKDKTRVRFHVESVGQLHPAQIVRHALTLFAERCRDLARVLQSTEVVVTDKNAPL